MSEEDRTLLKAVLDEMELHIIIQRGYTPYLSNIILHKRPNKSPRAIHDSRVLNLWTVPIKFKMPTFEEVLSHFRGNKLYGSMDLTYSYAAIRIEKD